MSLEERRFYMENCDRCSHCKWAPGVASERFATSCPSIDSGKFHTYSASGRISIAYGLLEGRLGYSDELAEFVYACTMCGACDTGCKWNHSGSVEPLDTLYALRQRIAGDGRAPRGAKDIIESLRRNGNPYGKPRAERAFWARGDDATHVPESGGDTLLHVGCENAYTPSIWPELRTIAGLLNEAGIQFHISTDEGPTGAIAFDLGFQNDAREMAEALAASIRSSGVRRLITSSASAYAAFRNFWPRLGMTLDGIEVVHITQVVAEALEGGRIRRHFEGEGKVTYHDPCKLGRLSEPYRAWSGQWTTALNQVMVTDPPRPVRFGNDGQYHAPRALLRRIRGVDLVEMERCERVAYCCGAGAASTTLAPAMANQAALLRLEEARASGASVLVSSCANCTTHLRSVATRHSLPVAVTGLFEFLSESTTRPTGEAQG